MTTPYPFSVLDSSGVSRGDRSPVPSHVLVIEDDVLDARLIREWLREAGEDRFTSQHVDHLSAGLAALGTGGVDVVLLDLGLPDSQGLDTFARLHAAAPQVPVVVLSGVDDLDLSVEALHAGAQDYLPKDRANGGTLARVLRYTLERQHWLAREQAARRRAEVLARASGVLAESLDYSTTLRQVGDLVVGSLASFCTIDLLQEDGSLQRLCAAGSGSRNASAAQELATYAPRPTTAHPAWHVLRTGQPVLLTKVPEVLLAALAVDTEHLALIRRLELGAWLVVPLQVQGRVLGTLQLLWSAKEPDEQPDGISLSKVRAEPAEVLRLARALADRAAVALDNARLHADLQAALAARDALLASVAHDLRNPLGTIKLLAQLGRRQLAAPPDSPKPYGVVVDALARVDVLTKRMDGYIQELVDAAALQQGGALALNRSPLDFVALVRGMVDGGQADDHTVRLEAPEGELVVDADELRMERVVQNLLSNALKYSPPEREVLITMERVVGSTGAWASLTIRDQGVGIPAADLPRIFERFHRASNVRERVKGTGLGLWGARQIVEQHGGTLTLQTQEGVGTAVTVRLLLVSWVDTDADSR